MTREEAIKELKYVKKQTGYADEAIDMAIKALEQEPRTGYWIYTPIKRLIDDEECKYITDYRCSCSKCGSDFGFQKMSDAYCKYCGSRMVEPQESEE